MVIRASGQARRSARRHGVTCTMSPSAESLTTRIRRRLGQLRGGHGPARSGAARRRRSSPCRGCRRARSPVRESAGAPRPRSQARSPGRASRDSRWASIGSPGYAPAGCWKRSIPAMTSRSGASAAAVAIMTAPFVGRAVHRPLVDGDREALHREIAETPRPAVEDAVGEQSRLLLDRAEREDAPSTRRRHAASPRNTHLWPDQGSRRLHEQFTRNSRRRRSRETRVFRGGPVAETQDRLARAEGGRRASSESIRRAPDPNREPSRPAVEDRWSQAAPPPAVAGCPARTSRAAGAAAEGGAAGLRRRPRERARPSEGRRPPGSARSPAPEGCRASRARRPHPARNEVVIDGLEEPVTRRAEVLGGLAADEDHGEAPPARALEDRPTEIVRSIEEEERVRP